MKYKNLMAIAIFGLLLLSQTVLKADGDTLWCHYTYPTSIYAVKFTPDGKYVATIGNLWDAQTGELVREFIDTNGYNTAPFIDINNTGTSLVSSSAKVSYKVWDIQTGKLLKTLFEDDTNHSKFYSSGRVKFSHNGTMLACELYQTQSNSGVAVYNTTSWEKIAEIDNLTSIGDISFSKDDKKLAIGQSTIQFYSTETWENLGGLTGYGATIVCYSEDGNYLATGNSSGNIYIFTTSDNHLYKTFNHYGGVNAIAFSPDGNYLVEGGGGFQNGKINIWDINSNTIKYSYILDWLIKKYLGINCGDDINTISVNSNSKYIINGGTAGTYILNAKWNTSSISENIITITQNTIYPNPTSSIANIEFTLFKDEQASINIYDTNSNLIAKIYNGLLTSGIQNLQWNTSGVTSGVFYCNININNSISTIKIIVNK